jgi:hypothetical protein
MSTIPLSSGQTTHAGERAAFFVDWTVQFVQLYKYPDWKANPTRGAVAADRRRPINMPGLLHFCTDEQRIA